jgi:hypothetical protein
MEHPRVDKSEAPLACEGLGYRLTYSTRCLDLVWYSFALGHQQGLVRTFHSSSYLGKNINTSIRVYFYIILKLSHYIASFGCVLYLF